VLGKRIRTSWKPKPAEPTRRHFGNGPSETRYPVEMVLVEASKTRFDPAADQPPDIGNKLFYISLEDVQINTRYLIPA